MSHPLRPVRMALAALLPVAGITCATLAQAAPAVSFERAPFGTTDDGRPVEQYTLRNAHGMTVRFMTYGGIITAIETPDRHGNAADVVLGFSTLGGYTHDSARGGLFFGAMIGRYANRLARGTFTLDGHTYHIAVTAPPNALHGGRKGFDKQVWTFEGETHDDHGTSVTLGLVSPDGDQGFPGTLHVHVTYRLDDTSALSLHYTATTDRPTVLNLTNHSYFNLGGEGSGSVENQVLRISADTYTPTDATSIPLGPIASVAGTPLDFRTPHRIGERLRDNDPQMMYARGYDHNWIVNGQAGTTPRPAAQISDPATGRTMEVLTTQPGLQVYTSNSLDGGYAGVSGRAYRQTDAVAFEAEHFPDSPNHPDFPTTELRPGETFDQTTIFRFGVTKGKGH
ncbi:aldose epimerase family protein [Novacetimonas pomaceti]|uniref:Aldose 1-epimerase n=1 Tax=Novacetimonas pomaceti TaxID=2021998 RepID=A0ABX5P5T0_9PROT|nr:galactose-1-epimerase [Novacetimonas pomaceti]